MVFFLRIVTAKKIKNVKFHSTTKKLQSWQTQDRLQVQRQQRLPHPFRQKKAVMPFPGLLPSFVL
jgi:hypothetical protein